MKEFIRGDCERLARERLRRQKHKSSVLKYQAESRNCTLTRSEVMDDERYDRFFQGLEPKVKTVELKSKCTTFEDAALATLSVEECTSCEGVTANRESTSREGVTASAKRDEKHYFFVGHSALNRETSRTSQKM